MENAEDKDFYRSLRKKELQDLCKIYGLSPYMTKSNLVNSLHSYLKKKNLSSASQVEISGIHPASLKPPPKCESELNNLVHAFKDSYKNINSGQENRENQLSTVKCSEENSKASGLIGSEGPLYNGGEISGLGCKRRETSCTRIEYGSQENGFGCRVQSPRITSDRNNCDHAREIGAGDGTQIQSKTVNSGASLAENNASTFSRKASVSIRPFEFHVSAEEGINLIVDLNSSPSDWLNRLAGEVCGFHIAHCTKFGSLREQLEILGNSSNQKKNSYMWNAENEHEMNNDHVGAGSSCISTKRESDPLVVDNLCGTDGSLSSPTKPCKVATDLSALVDAEKELLPNFRPNCDVQNLVPSGAESCQIDMETIPVELSDINTPLIKSSSNSIIDSTQEGPKSPYSLEPQNLGVGDKNCEYVALKNASTCLGPSIMYPGSSSSGSMELQLSEVASQRKDAPCSPCRNSLEVVDIKSNVETRDDEIDNSSACVEAQEHLSACVEEREENELFNGAETSESSYLKRSLGKTPEELKRKREHSDGEDLCYHSELDAKTVRSRKLLSGRVLPRRSTRLVSKV